MQEEVGEITAAGADLDAAGRPTRILAISDLLRLSAFWLGLTAIDYAVNLFVQYRLNFDHLVEPTKVGTATAFIGLGAALVAVAVQPTVGAISDYAVTRWGRRKPFIVFGAVFDSVFLLAIANAQTVIAIALFVTLLAFSTNVARGPFQGYVPDLVAAPQVGLASALVGLMQVVGNVVGAALVPIASALNSLPLALVAVAIIELVTMASVVYRVPQGRGPKPRDGRSWWAIARSTWATDVLRERSYVWLLISRFFFLAAGGVIIAFVIAYLVRTFALTRADADRVSLVVLAVVVGANALAVVPAARISDRTGRKPVIYASAGLGVVGTLVLSAAPSLEVAIVGAAVFGVGSGMFLAVDWALMTDIIPTASAGRYMGLSNVATGAAGIFAGITGGVLLDSVTVASGSLPLGPRVAYLLATIYFGLSAVALRRVVEPRAVAPPSAGQAQEAAQPA